MQTFLLPTIVVIAIVMLTPVYSSTSTTIEHSTDELSNLLQTLSFYNNFDNNVNALVANGENRPVNPGLHFKYANGIVNKGLLIGDNSNTVPPQFLTKNNIDPKKGTLSLWFKPKYSSEHPIVSKKDYRWLFSSRGSNNRFYLQYKRKSLSLDYFINTPTASWKADEWRHIVITWTSHNYTLYIDGTLIKNKEVNKKWGKLLGFGHFFTVGGYLYKGKESASGVIDELAIWKRNISIDEVKLLYKTGVKQIPLIDPASVSITNAPSPPAIDYKLNALENGSFEAGISNWVITRIPKTFSPALPSFASINTHNDLVSINTKSAHHGNNALRLKLSGRHTVAPTIVQNTAEISTLAFPLIDTNKQYASFWIRSESAETFKVKLSLEGMKQTEKGEKSLQKTFSFKNRAGKWNLINISGFPGKAYDDLFRLKIVIENTSNKPTYYDIDSIIVSSTNPQLHDYKYQTDHSITGTISTGKPANMYSSEEPLTLKLNLANQTDKKATSSLKLKVFDYFNKVILEQSIAPIIDKNHMIIQTLPVNTDRYGIYRAVLYRNDEEVVDNITFTSLPVMQQHKSIGIHTVSDDYSLSIAKRLGFYWHRLWDNGKPTAWTSTQPASKGNFRWEYSDNIVNKTLEHGLTPIGLISWPLYWERSWLSNKNPGWMHEKWNPDHSNPLNIEVFENPEFQSEWKKYVKGVVSHYKNKIKHWELLNEPYRLASAKWVARLYKTTVPVIKSAHEDALILGPCTHIRKKWTDELINLGILDYIDIFSYHGYDMTPSDLRSMKKYSALDGQKRLIFDTENSGSTSAQFFCENCPGNTFSGDHDYKQSAIIQVKSLLQSLGEGTNTYFYYWMVSYDAYNNYRSFINYDGTLRSSAVAFSIAGWLLGDFHESAPISNKTIQAFYFRRNDGTTIISLWPKESKTTSLQLRHLPGDIVVKDIMGNTIYAGTKPHTIDLKKNEIIYIESNNTEIISAIRKLD